MGAERRLTRLGFTKEAFPEGTHVCQIFSDDEERSWALKAFLLAGLQEGERTGCFLADLKEPEGLRDLLEEHDLDLEALRAEDRFQLLDSREVYFKDGRFDGRFDPDQPFGLFTRLREASLQAGRTMRVMGEMSPDVARVEGGRPLVRYEQALSLFLQRKPMTIVCQYDAAAFHGAVIMDVLKVHPMMVLRGEVIHNPFYEPPKGLPPS
jgi:hypothetical protein